MNAIDANIKSIPKLLRAMAKGNDAIKNKHDLIFNQAAFLIEHLSKFREGTKALIEKNKQ